MFRLFKIKSKRQVEIYPEDIFLDSANLSGFDSQQFEGRIERPISKQSIMYLSIFFALVGVIFLWKLQVLQIREGQAFFEKSENNSLYHQVLFADRGIIYDRNNVELAWNSASTDDETFPDRVYYSRPGFGHVLGYVGYPEKDSKGYYWQTEFIGKEGIEKKFNEVLNGENGLRLIEKNVMGEVMSENMVDQPKEGENIILTVDAGVQEAMYNAITELSKTSGFRGGAGIIMNIHTGELLSITSFPEYDPAIISKGTNQDVINQYVNDPRKPFLDRFSNLYAPGSVMKIYFALGALEENIINPDEWLPSNGQISIPNPYDRSNPTIFKDSHVHGPVDMRRAIAVSSNTYFYEIGGGYNGRTGLGIDRLGKYAKLFGLAEEVPLDFTSDKDGVIPGIEWKKKNFAEGVWRVGDTYNSSIGQYGWQVTPLQLVRAVSAVANRGLLVNPHITFSGTEPNVLRRVDGVSDESYQVVQEGMRQTVTEGTGQLMNLPFVNVAAKTGTAQVGAGNTHTNSWVSGFFPYENPEYAFVVLMDYGPKNFQFSSAFVVREVLTWMRDNRPEYLGLEKVN
jgi:penicillin-binding protein 2